MEKQRRSLAQQVVRLRDKQRLSWQAIAEQVDRSPATCRRLYDDLKGEGAHVGLLPGKGGRLPVDHKPSSSTRRKAA